MPKRRSKPDRNCGPAAAIAAVAEHLDGLSENGGGDEEIDVTVAAQRRVWIAQVSDGRALEHGVGHAGVVQGRGGDQQTLVQTQTGDHGGEMALRCLLQLGGGRWQRA